MESIRAQSSILQALAATALEPAHFASAFQSARSRGQIAAEFFERAQDGKRAKFVLIVAYLWILVRTEKVRSDRRLNADKHRAMTIAAAVVRDTRSDELLKALT